MQEKLEEIFKQYVEITKMLSSPDIIQDLTKYKELKKTLKDIDKVMFFYRQHKDKMKAIAEDQNLLNTEKDVEIRNMLKADIVQKENEILELEEKIKLELRSKDANDNKNVILELHAGVGGDEAGIFVGDLFKMYCKYSETQHWKVDVIEYVECTSGGYKDIACNIIGENVYGKLKYESGVHRVQRIPKTESKGRIHTSAASVIILPEIDDVDIKLDMHDIRKDTYCSTGAGGQSVNTTYSAVRLTHIPSGIVVTCQDERSQIKNYDKALKVLRARLYDREKQKQHEDINTQKKTMVKSGDRADKIRTYNYPQNRITDHRINFTVHNLEQVMNGYLDEILNALSIQYTNI